MTSQMPRLLARLQALRGEEKQRLTLDLEGRIRRAATDVKRCAEPTVLRAVRALASEELEALTLISSAFQARLNILRTRYNRWKASTSQVDAVYLEQLARHRLGAENPSGLHFLEERESRLRQLKADEPELREQLLVQRSIASTQPLAPFYGEAVPAILFKDELTARSGCRYRVVFIEEGAASNPEFYLICSQTGLPRSHDVACILTCAYGDTDVTFKADDAGLTPLSLFPNDPKSTQLEMAISSKFDDIIRKWSTPVRWKEDNITMDVVDVIDRLGQFEHPLRAGTLVRVRATKQHGVPEARYGDILLIVQLLGQSERPGIAYIEAKKVDFYGRRLRLSSRVRKQLSRIKKNADGFLLVYDRKGQSGWSTVTARLTNVPLEATVKLVSLQDVGGVPFAQQLVRRYFLGEDLIFDPIAVAEAAGNAGSFVETAVVQVIPDADGRDVQQLLIEMDGSLDALFSPVPRRRQRIQRLEYDLESDLDLGGGSGLSL